MSTPHPLCKRLEIEHIRKFVVWSVRSSGEGFGVSRGYGFRVWEQELRALFGVRRSGGHCSHAVRNLERIEIGKSPKSRTLAAVDAELKTLREYIKAVSKHWWAIVTGLALTVLDGIERLFGTWYLAPQWVKVATGVAGLVLAQYLAYRDLAHSLPDTTAEFNERLRTVFRNAELRWSLINKPGAVFSFRTAREHVDDFREALATLYGACPPSLDSQRLHDVVEKLHRNDNDSVVFLPEQEVGQLDDKMMEVFAEVRAMLREPRRRRSQYVAN